MIALAKSDGKVFSLFNRLNIGNNLGLDITKELIEADLIELVDSREMPLKQYKKQLIKKELKDYTIEPKLYFKKPFFRFWYLCIEPYRDKKFKINAKLVIKKYLSDGYRLSSLVFEQLSLELLKKEFLKDGISIAGSSYWDRYSEFDIYAKSSSGIYILGECKYKGRAVTKLELTRLQEKANISNLIVDQYALFSKSGFTNELKKDSSVLLYDLESFKKLI